MSTFSFSSSVSLFLFLCISLPYLPRRLQQSLHEVCLEALGVQAASLERRAEVPDLHLSDGVGRDFFRSAVSSGVCVLFRRHFGRAEGMNTSSQWPWRGGEAKRWKVVQREEEKGED